MVFSMDMRRIKRESYRVIRQDGLSDICGGLMLGMMAVFFLDFRYAGALIVGCAMQTIILPTCRRKITYPRVGYVKFPGRTDKKSFVVWDVAVPLAAVGLIICAGIWAMPLLPLCLGVLLAGLALTGARVTGYARDFLLAGLFLATGLVGSALALLGHDPAVVTAYQLWGLSAVLVPVGLVQLVRFLRDYPLPTKEVADGR